MLTDIQRTVVERILTQACEYPQGAASSRHQFPLGPDTRKCWLRFISRTQTGIFRVPAKQVHRTWFRGSFTCQHIGYPYRGYPCFNLTSFRLHLRLVSRNSQHSNLHDHLMFISTPTNAHIICLFVFGVTAPIGPGSSHSRGFYITHDTSQSVGLLWTSDQLVAETSTWQHTTDKHPCSRWDSNPQSQQASGLRTTP